VSQYLQCFGVDHRQGINPGLGHVQAFLIRGNAHAKGDYPSKLSDSGVGLQIDGMFHRIGLKRDHRNIVVGPVAHKYVFIGGHQRIWAGTSHGGNIFHLGTHQVACFGFGNDSGMVRIVQANGKY